MSSLLFNVYSSLSNHHSSAFDLNSIHSTKVDAPHVEYTNIYLPDMYNCTLFIPWISVLEVKTYINFFWNIWNLGGLNTLSNWFKQRKFIHFNNEFNLLKYGTTYLVDLYYYISISFMHSTLQYTSIDVPCMVRHFHWSQLHFIGAFSLSVIL